MIQFDQIKQENVGLKSENHFLRSFLKDYEEPRDQLRLPISPPHLETIENIQNEQFFDKENDNQQFKISRKKHSKKFKITEEEFEQRLEENLIEHNLLTIEINSKNRLEIINREINSQGIILRNSDKSHMIKIIKLNMENFEKVSLEFLKYYFLYKVCNNYVCSKSVGFNFRSKSFHSQKNAIRFSYSCKKLKKNSCQNRLVAAYYLDQKIICVSWTGIKCCKHKT